MQLAIKDALTTIFIAFCVVGLMTGCARLIQVAGAPDKVVDTVQTAEEILCVADTVGLPFETLYPNDWIPEVINTFCNIKAGFAPIALTSAGAQQRLVTACVNTLPERAELTEEHYAYIQAWDEVCDVE